MPQWDDELKEELIELSTLLELCGDANPQAEEVRARFRARVRP